MNTNEAILNKLIELRYLDFTTLQMMESLRVTHLGVYELMLADIIQRALFDECHKRKLFLCTKWHGGFDIGTSELYRHDDIIFQATDTYRESFVQAFCKVVGI